MIQHIHIFRDKWKAINKIKKYYAESERRGQRITVSSLAAHMGVDRSSLYYHSRRGGPVADVLAPLFPHGTGNAA